MQFFLTTARKKDLSTRALSTTPALILVLSKGAKLLSGNSAPNTALLKLCISLTGKIRKGTYNANYKHYSQSMHWSENTRKSLFCWPLPCSHKKRLDTLDRNAAYYT